MMMTTPHQGPATLHAPHSNSMHKQQLDTTAQQICEFELGQWQPVQLVTSLHSVSTSSFIDAKTTSSSDWVKERLACSFPKSHPTSRPSRFGWTRNVSISSSWNHALWNVRLENHERRTTDSMPTLGLQNFSWQSSFETTKTTDDCQCPIKTRHRMRG